ncbi:hypothetical protein BJ508DRAFT_376906 [Ascobolus immersus RN42]|uniref:t-SNARE coiled-coil homology domain-containing protein n=1 Tax=Ascobolus immersus RN42 TaxID=1160509 RepID=A0A3N4I9C4_ASCIM|nr:hypothetical protein BJ508DRAFT_376906 [Ascobolus immersus RN42]
MQVITAGTTIGDIRKCIGFFDNHSPSDQQDPFANPNPYAQPESNPYAQPQQGYNSYAPTSAQSQPQQNTYEMRTLGQQSTDIGHTAQEAHEIIWPQVRESKQMMANILALRVEMHKDMDKSESAEKKRQVDRLMAELQSFNKQLKTTIQRARGKFGEGTVIDTDMNTFMKNIKEHTEAERALATELQRQLVAQYKIAHNIQSDDPEGDREAWQAVESGQVTQIFQSAAMGARRQGARNALSNAQARHQEIQNIAQQMEELLQLFETMNQMIIEQEPVVEQIHTSAVEAQTNIEDGVQQLGTGIESAKAARRKKWWCLLIVVILIVIIVIVVMVVVVKPIIEESNKNKRSLEYLAHTRRSLLEGNSNLFSSGSPVGTIP